ncbi:hypothetical protein [Salinarimonas rosea]|uniref:hypothetical protein n=1 Tax=Salinarimonas rosea TaxID=552063 RepID=UPI0003F514AB|nr:hypothetical protein [Salinarimonas rosea]
MPTNDREVELRRAAVPDARARAILRGREIAAQDLRDAGGAYDLEQVRTVLGDISRQMVARKVEAGQLLAVPGPSGQRIYPTFQFAPDGSLLPSLPAILAALPTRDPWAVLNFLVNSDERLDERRPVDLLREGKSAAVLAAAAHLDEQGA